MVYLRACDITTAVLKSVIKLDLFLIRKKERSYLFVITEVTFYKTSITVTSRRYCAFWGSDGSNVVGFSISCYTNT
jgi:hypothetical protein